MTMLVEPTPTRAAVTKAVIPAAGPGARFLPATKEPKEMLPVIDKPAIQYVVEEAVSAGCHDLLLVTNPGKRSIEDHFDIHGELEDALADGIDQRLAEIRHGSRRASVHYIRQAQPLGLGHAVLQAEQHVGNEPFVVLLGDDLIDVRDPVLPRMLDVRARYGGSVVALLEVPRDQISAYGCADVRVELDAGVVEVADLVEKPAAEEAPSRLAVIGRYLLDPQVFPVLRSTPPGRDGEIQLTDALRTLATMPADHGGGVRGVIFRGRRYDTGDRLSYLKAVVQLACERPDLGPDFSHWLRGFAATLRG
ncbi:MAG: UTP--glucose-1-phosphate uridylyltransferase [Candidatus Nanopelagicales bacterium]|jgi:UTP--glucose-1-phosphate uridylyltransferase|nr:UTP--glucose-1-phosphate uridylyltransferase [Candidatus Nanopelagicales bacterium]